MVKQTDSWIIFDGALTGAGEPVAVADSRGLMYGDGVFDTLRVYKGQTLFFGRHLDRLKSGLHTLGIDERHIPPEKNLEGQIFQLLQENRLTNQDAIVRLQFWRGGNRGYVPRKQADVHYTVTATPCPDYNEQYPSLATVSTRRIPSESLPSVGKFTNGINYILAAREAADQGADDAIMLTVDGWISETTIANIFWISGDRISTPSVDCDLIPGITRQVVLDIISNKTTLNIQEGSFPIEAVFNAEGAAVCNSVREIMPVRRINDRHFSTHHPVLNKLQELFVAKRNQNLKALPDIE